VLVGTNRTFISGADSFSFSAGENVTLQLTYFMFYGMTAAALVAAARRSVGVWRPFGLVAVMVAGVAVVAFAYAYKVALVYALTIITLAIHYRYRRLSPRMIAVALGAFVFVAAFTANRLLSPAAPAMPAGKRASYECGLDPVGHDWAQVHVRYYLYAYLYVLFAVESVFLFPWAVIYARPGFGAATVVEMAIFVAVLALGLLYAYRKRVLRWS